MTEQEGIIQQTLEALIRQQEEINRLWNQRLDNWALQVTPRKIPENF